MRSIIKLFVLILFYFSVLICYAQSSGGIAIREVPDKFVRMTENTNLAKGNENETLFGRAWIVYSDRSNNVTFKNPKCKGSKYRTGIDFMEGFYVIDETDYAVHIIKEENLSEKLTISRKADDYGWIPKDKLLLTQNCLLTYPGRFSRKVLYGNILTENTAASGQLKQFSTPYLNDDNKESLSISNIELFYVYKEIENTLLVSKSERISIYEDNKHEMTWINKNQIVDWDIPIAIEPNWQKEAIEEREQHHITPCLFSKQSKAQRYFRKLSTKKAVCSFSNDLMNSGERLNGSVFRFPYAERYGDIIKVILHSDDRYSGKFGFAPYYINYLRYPVFSRVLLLSRLELSEILFKYKFLYSESFSNKRTALRIRLIGLVKEKFPQMTSENIEKLSLCELGKIIYGICSDSNFKNLKLFTIVRYDLVDNQTIESLVTELQQKYSTLREIFSSANYPYTILLNNITYYWIPVNYLPL